MAKHKPTKISKRAQADIKRGARQSVKTAKSQVRAAKSAGTEQLRAAQKKARAATKIAKKDRKELAAQGRALKKLGLYSTRKPLNLGSITKARAKTIQKKFRELERHGYYEHGRKIKPLYRAPEGYKLNPNFKFVKSKRKPSTNIGIIRTRKGVIIETRDKKASRFKVMKDGTIVSRQEAFGKVRNVYTGSMTFQQQLAFVNSIYDGSFQFPDNFIIAISVFGYDRTLVTSTAQLLAFLKKHQKELESGLSAHRPVIALEYIELTPSETRANRRARHA